MVSSSSARSSGVEVEVGRAEGRRRRLDRREGCPQVVGDGREETRAGAPDLRRRPVPRARRPRGGCGRWRRPVPRRGPRAGPRSDESSGWSLRAVTSTSSGATWIVSDAPGCAGAGCRRRRCRAPAPCTRRALNRATSASAAPATTDLRILAFHQPGREVEADLGLTLALLGGAASRVEPRDRPAQHARRGDEGDEGDQVVSLLHVEAPARRGEEVVEREEPARRADDGSGAPEEGGEQRGDEQQQCRRREVDLEQAPDPGRDGDDRHRTEGLETVLGEIATVHRVAPTRATDASLRGVGGEHGSELVDEGDGERPVVG